MTTLPKDPAIIYHQPSLTTKEQQPPGLQFQAPVAAVIHKAQYRVLRVAVLELILIGALSVVMVENYLAYAHTLRRNLNKFVLLYILKALLKAHYNLGYDTRLVV